MQIRLQNVYIVPVSEQNAKHLKKAANGIHTIVDTYRLDSVSIDLEYSQVFQLLCQPYWYRFNLISTQHQNLQRCQRLETFYSDKAIKRQI